MPETATPTEPTKIQLLERYDRLSAQLDQLDWRTPLARDLIECRRAIRRELERIAESEASRDR